MANILPENKVNEAKAWLHDVFIWGGLSQNPLRSVSIDKYRYMYGIHSDNFRQSDPKYQDAAKTICSCIRHRKVETQRFLAFDKAIKTLSVCNFIPNLKEAKGSIRETPDVLCSFIAWFCDVNGYVYDNINTSVEEMKQVKGTLIGATLWDNYLFAKGNTPETRPASTKADVSATASTVSQPAPTTSKPATPGTKLPDGTKQTSPQHTLYRSNANGIVDPSLPKVSPIGVNGLVYKIVGKGSTPTKITLHVKPQYARTPLKVNYGVGTGWNDCMLFFASDILAKDFRDKAWAAKPSSITVLDVVSTREDKNGYVEVETEFGKAYIPASKLHEDLEEEVKDNKPEEKKVSNKEVWEAFRDGFFGE